MPTLPNYPNRVIRPGYTNTGWTTFVPSATTQITYCSDTAGHDNYCGFSDAFKATCDQPNATVGGSHGGPSHGPKKTISAGVSNLRDGYPDWLLLRRGDTWTGQNIFGLSKSGTASAKLLISTYGTGARPVLRTAGSEGVWIGADISHVAIVGIEFTAHTYNGTASSGTPAGIDLGYHAVDDLLIEDCLVHNYKTGLELTGAGASTRATNINIRRSVFHTLYGTPPGVSHSQGLYVLNTDGVTIEECVFHNISMDVPTIYEHGMYIDYNDNANITARNNLLANICSHGVMMRCGGAVTGNVFAKCGVGFEVGSTYSVAYQPSGVDCYAYGNTVLDAIEDGDNPGGYGCLIEHVSQGYVRNNVFANSDPANVTLSPAITFGHPAYSSMLTHGIEISSNTVYGWPATSGTPDSLVYFWSGDYSGLTFNGNDIQQSLSGELGRLVEFAEASDTTAVTASSNKYHRESGTTADWFSIGGANKTLAEFKSALSDSTSVAQQVSYPTPDAATLAGYHASLGQTATHDAFMAEAIQQRKGNWRDAYTAQAVNAYIRQCFGK